MLRTVHILKYTNVYTKCKNITSKTEHGHVQYLCEKKKKK